MAPRRNGSLLSYFLVPSASLLALSAPLLLGLRRLKQIHPVYGFYFSLYLGLVNIFTFMLYWHDKARGRIGGFRVSEMRMHTCELLGGWPAAFVSQRLLRHKTRKFGYQAVFWPIVLIHEIAWIDLITGGALLRSPSSL